MNRRRWRRTRKTRRWGERKDEEKADVRKGDDRKHRSREVRQVAVRGREWHAGVRRGWHGKEGQCVGRKRKGSGTRQSRRGRNGTR